VNVTISLPDDLIRDARHEAVDRGMSLSAYVAAMLEERIEARRLKRQRQEDLLRMMDERPLTVGPITWTRDELHER
jgi:hypothetical protein